MRDVGNIVTEGFADDAEPNHLVMRKYRGPSVLPEKVEAVAAGFELPKV